MSTRDRLVFPFRVLLGAAIVGTLAWASTLIPAGLARLDVFRVVETSVDGRRILSHAEVLEIAAIPAGASVWDSFDPWVERLEEHPMVDDAVIVRELPGTLRISIVEREAVALVATPMLEPVDRDGRVLPIDPARVPLDLPIIHLREDPAQEGRPPSAARIRPLARTAERMRAEVTFWSRLSELTEAGNGAARARWGGDVIFTVPLDVDPYRLRDGVTALRHALDDPDRTPLDVDLRWADQIIVRSTRRTRGT